MWFTFIAVFIISVLLNLINSHHYDSQTAYHRLLSRSLKKELHKFETHGKGCNEEEFSKKAKTVVVSSFCSKPRLTVVHVTPIDPSTEFFPNYVEVKRCQGTCSRTQACLPTKVVTKKIPVHRKNVKGQKDCGFVHVEEHVRCKCGCAVMKEHCNELQEYNSQECMCVCKEDMGDKSNCEALGRVWNMDRCGCDCREENMDCTTGMVWVPSMCQCMKVMY